MKRLLCILANMNSGGAETFLMKLYRNIDREKYQMDFCINIKEKCFYEDEILSLGGRIYRIPPKSENVRKFRQGLTKIIRENRYEYVLRITSSAAGFMDLKIAKKAGAKICAARSSNSSDGESWKALIAHKIGQLLYGKYVDVKIAPSDLAAKYTFGERAYELGQVHILHNGLDLSVYNYSEKARDEIRNEFSIKEDTIVIGHVGRFVEQKNHLFLIDVFEAYRRDHNNAVLLLVGGNGNLEDAVRQKVKNLGLGDSVIFTGVRSDIPALLSAMDTFVMPSLYEGMPNAVIEAQATGLPCIVSDTITREANITGCVKYVSLSHIDCWTKEIECVQEIHERDVSALLESKEYDIKSVVKNFEQTIFYAAQA